MIPLLLIAGCALPVEAPGQSSTYESAWIEAEDAESCDVMEQDCPDGQKCSLADPHNPDEGYDPVCMDLLGEREEGELCDAWTTGQDQCDAGMKCWVSCRAFCDGDCGDVGLPGHECVYIYGTDEGLCFPSCDPLQWQECGFQHNCTHIGGGTFTCLPAYDSAPQLEEECASVLDCAPGSTCLSGTCYPYCDRSDLYPDCPEGTGCEDMQGVSDERVGVCK